MATTNILTDYFRRENDNIYDGGKYTFIHEYDSYKIMKGGAVTNSIKREKKINRQKRLEELNKLIRENKKLQVRLLYDVTFEQIDIENEENITNTQTQLDSELKALEKEREKIKKEVAQEETDKIDKIKEHNMELSSNMEILKNKESRIQDKQTAYHDIQTSIGIMYDIRTKRNIYEVNVPLEGSNRMLLSENIDVELNPEEISDDDEM